MEWFVLLFFAAFSAQADTSCSDLEHAWRAKYTVDFRVTWNLKGFKCPGGESTVAQALWDLEHLQLEPPSNGAPPNFYEIVSSHIDSFARDNTDKKDYAYTAEGLLTICPSYYTDERWDRASTLVHEARHMDEGEPGHVICKAGPYKGKSQGCDQEFFGGEWKGSGFNADLVFLGWLRTAPNSNELSQSVVDSDINAVIPDRFNVVKAEDVKLWRR